ncbi:glycosyltransferase family 4 protein [Aestuariivivens marinum]|uniref:glycosyltransferase family 4 protein n=1 Tax=Aestuariivivens marinum TaxID=2913555 RepID=UPI001F5ABC14|nr:glycosyltransferase family 4 protein [Aestuariivivens marinum]
MAKTKRILIVSSEFPPQPGGIGNHAYNLAKALQHSSFEVTVLVDSRSRTGKVEENFDINLPFNVIRIDISRFRPIMYLKRVKHYIKMSKHNDYIIASGKFSLWLVGFCTLFIKKPCLAIIHGTEVNFKSHILKGSIAKALKQFNYVVAVSNYTKQLVKHLKLKSIKVIQNGYDPESWNVTSTDLKKELKGSPKLITVGRISERKGQARVIEHLPHLIKTYPKLHYHCVGIDSEKDTCLQLAKALDIENHVTFHGEASQDYLKTLVSQCDIKVMLSTETKTGDIEGFGIAIIEANALGIPAIGSFGTGIEDAIAHGVSGQLIDSKNPVAFADAVSTILNNEAGFRKESLSWAEKHRWNIIVKQYVDVIESSY